MGDLGEDALVDVSRFSLRDLLDEVDESGLAHVLDRILSSEQDSGHYAFNNFI
jgi:FXSXX-COOH protein